MCSFQQYCRIMGSIFSEIGGLMGPKFEPKWPVPSKNYA